MSASLAESPAAHRIFEAALVVFSRYGFRRASMEAVAAQAHHSRQGLYRHFPSKEALFASVIETMHDLADQAGEAAMDAARAARRGSGEILGALVAARMAFYAGRVMDSPHAAELMEESTRIGGTIIAARAEAARATLAKAISAERTAGRLTLKRGVTPAELAGLLTAASNGVKHGAPMDAEAMRASVVRIAMLMVDGARG